MPSKTQARSRLIVGTAGYNPTEVLDVRLLRLLCCVCSVQRYGLIAPSEESYSVCACVRACVCVRVCVY